MGWVGDAVRRVVKFGGVVLATPEKVREMAGAIPPMISAGDEVAVVVSAMGDTTNRLHKTFLTTTAGEYEEADLERYLTLGEEESALAFAAALRSMQQKAKAILPRDAGFPVRVRISGPLPPLMGEKGNEPRPFSLREPACQKAVQEVILPLLKAGVVPVVCGFAARDQRGRIITLGRGASDLTAFILAHLLNADELLLVKDVEGVYTADPRFTSSRRRISFLTSRELEMLTGAGSGVLHPSAVRFMTKKTAIRIVPPGEDKWEKTGTIVQPVSPVSISACEEPVAVVSFIGHGFSRFPSLLNPLSQALESLHIPVHSITFSDDLVAFYIPEKSCEQAYEAMSRQALRISAITSSTIKKGLGKITLSSPEFIYQPGVLEKMLRPISRKGINIWEIVTLHSDIHIFIEYKDVSAVLEILQKGREGR